MKSHLKKNQNSYLWLSSHWGDIQYDYFWEGSGWSSQSHFRAVGPQLHTAGVVENVVPLDL